MTCNWGDYHILCISSQALPGWMGVSLHRYFQVSPKMFDRVQVRALAGPLNYIQRLVSKPVLFCLCCVLVVLLEGGTLPQFEFLSALEQVSSRISLYFAPFIFPAILTSHPVPAAEKHPHSMMLPPPCFTVGMVPGFLQTFRPILVSSDQRILFLMVRVL